MNKVLRKVVNYSPFLSIAFITLPILLLVKFWNKQPDNYVYHLVNIDIVSIFIQAIILMTITLMYIYLSYYLRKNWVIITSHKKLISIVFLTTLINLTFYHAILYPLTIALEWYLYIIFIVVVYCFILNALWPWTMILVLYHVERGKVLLDTKDMGKEDIWSFTRKYLLMSSLFSLLYLVGVGLLINSLPLVPLEGGSFILVAISGLLIYGGFAYLSKKRTVGKYSSFFLLIYLLMVGLLINSLPFFSFKGISIIFVAISGLLIYQGLTYLLILNRLIILNIMSNFQPKIDAYEIDYNTPLSEIYRKK